MSRTLRGLLGVLAMSLSVVLVGFSSSWAATGSQRAPRLSPSADFSAALVARLAHQKRFEISEILHFGVRGQPEQYHLLVRYVAPTDLLQERNTIPGISIQVGNTLCSGPRRWHCRHQSFADLEGLLRALLLPQSAEMQTYLFDISYHRLSPTRIVIHALGDPWSCPPLSLGCMPLLPSPKVSSQPYYTAIVATDRSTGLPVTWKSWVTLARGPTTARQNIRFNYVKPFRITLPRYPKWKCPWWDPPGTWCMKEPGA